MSSALNTLWRNPARPTACSFTRGGRDRKVSVTYKDLFQSYAREDKRRVNKRLIAVMKTPLVGSGPTRLLFVMHADCGMTQLNTKMPSDYEWDAFPVDSLNPEHKSLAIHEKCALGSECLHYDHEKNRIISTSQPVVKLIYIKTTNVDRDYPKIEKVTGWTKNRIADEIYGIEDYFTGTDLVLAMAGIKVVGYANAVGGYQMQSVWIDPQYRRQGIATDMYDLIEKKTGKKLKQNKLASEDAKHFWKHRKTDR